MIEQATLFDAPVAKIQSVNIPPNPPAPPTPLVEPLGKCVKCGELAVLRSPGGSVYCSKHGYCARRTCLRSVEKMVWHERLGLWVCSCVVRFEQEVESA